MPAAALLVRLPEQHALRQPRRRTRARADVVGAREGVQLPQQQQEHRAGAPCAAGRADAGQRVREVQAEAAALHRPLQALHDPLEPLPVRLHRVLREPDERAARQEHLADELHVRLAIHRIHRVVERRQALLVGNQRGGAVLEQEVHDLLVLSGPHGPVERRPAVVVLRVHVGAPLHQQLHDVEVVIPHGTEERGVALLVLRVHVGVVLQQQLHDAVLVTREM